MVRNPNHRVFNHGGEGYKQTFKLGAVNGFTTRAVAVGEIAALEHEIGDDAVENGTRVAKAILTGGELTEVPGRPRHYVVVELEHDATKRFFIDSDIELSRVNAGHVRSTVGTLTKTFAMVECERQRDNASTA